MIRNIAIVHVNQYIFLVKIATKPWKDHKHMCKTISTLTAQSQEGLVKRGSYTVNLSTKQKHKVAGFIGEKSLKVLLNN